MQPEVSIVIPVYNESQNLGTLCSKLESVMNTLALPYEIIFVSDGSSDDTYSIIEKLHDANPRVKGIQLTRNFGHQNALRAGLDIATGNAVVMMDGDNQHPPEMIPELIQHWKAGNNVVHTIRAYKDWGFKAATSRLFYFLINKLSPVKILPGTADFRLMDRKTLELLKEHGEFQIFYRGLIPLLGLKQSYVPYSAQDRLAGESKYSLKRMLKLASNGVTSLSTIPLYFSIILGMFFSVMSMIYGIYVIAIKFYWGTAISGWTSIVLSVLLIGGIQMILLGIIGVYIAQIFYEVKKRPPYLIEKMLK